MHKDEFCIIYHIIYVCSLLHHRDSFAAFQNHPPVSQLFKRPFLKLLPLQQIIYAVNVRRECVCMCVWGVVVVERKSVCVCVCMHNTTHA